MKSYIELKFNCMYPIGWLADIYNNKKFAVCAWLLLNQNEVYRKTQEFKCLERRNEGEARNIEYKLIWMGAYVKNVLVTLI